MTSAPVSILKRTGELFRVRSTAKCLRFSRSRLLRGRHNLLRFRLQFVMTRKQMPSDLSSSTCDKSRFSGTILPHVARRYSHSGSSDSRVDELAVSLNWEFRPDLQTSHLS